MDAQALARIDGELEAFGKSEAEIAGATARARELARSLGDLDETLASLGAAPAPPADPALESSDIAGLSVDELFAQSETAAALPPEDPAPGLADALEPQATPDAIADLLDPEPLRLSDPDLGGLLEDVLEPRTVPPEAPDDEIDVAERTSDFELLVDEAVLAMNEEEPPPAAGAADDGEGDDERKPGLISRLFGRK